MSDDIVSSYRYAELRVRFAHVVRERDELEADNARLRKCVEEADMMRRYCNREDAAWVFDAARQAIDGKGKEPT